MNQLVAWLCVLLFACCYLGVWWFESPVAQGACGALATFGLTAAVAMILDANDEGV